MCVSTTIYETVDRECFMFENLYVGQNLCEKHSIQMEPA